jgi:hypothetical protein
MNEGDKLFIKLLNALESEGILKHFILIGGWCQRVYRHMFNYPPEISALRTADIDLLVQNLHKIKKNIDIAVILKDLGFDEIYSTPEGFIKYVHPDLEVEFLTAMTGKDQNKPFYLKQLNTNAQRLRYLYVIEDFLMETDYHGIKLYVPQPAAFVINKFISSQRRSNPAKREKDIMTAVEIGEYVLDDEEQKKIMKKIISGLGLKARKNLLEIIRINSNKIYNCLRMQNQ